MFLAQDVYNFTRGDWSSQSQCSGKVKQLLYIVSQCGIRERQGCPVEDFKLDMLSHPQPSVLVVSSVSNRTSVCECDEIKSLGNLQNSVVGNLAHSMLLCRPAVSTRNRAKHARTLEFSCNYDQCDLFCLQVHKRDRAV